MRAERDVIRFTDFVESYHNLTAKAIDIFDFGYRNSYAGVMKVDDDVYLRIPRLTAFLASNSDWENEWAGQFTESSYVVTDPSGRWYAYDQYPYEKWPTYCNGPGFFLGGRAIKYISENKKTLTRIRIDDAAVGVWLEHENLKKATMKVSFFDYVTDEDAIWVNPVNAEEMRRLHTGERFTLDACRDEKTACLCHGNPSFNSEQRNECWRVTGSNSYVDVIPRHFTTV